MRKNAFEIATTSKIAALEERISYLETVLVQVIAEARPKNPYQQRLPKATRDLRDSRIVGQYLQGRSLMSIGESEGISAEYVRQILIRKGVWKFRKDRKE